MMKCVIKSLEKLEVASVLSGLMESLISIQLIIIRYTNVLNLQIVFLDLILILKKKKNSFLSCLVPLFAFYIHII